MPDILTEDIVEAAVARLLELHAADAHLAASVGLYSSGDPWIFQDRNEAMVETSGRATAQGSSAVSVVLSQRPGESPNAHNTARFPRLVLEFFADPDRDDSGTVQVNNGRDKIMAAFQQIRHYWHRTNPAVEWWPSIPAWFLIGGAPPADYEATTHLRVTRCVALEDSPQMFEVPDGDGMVRAEVSFSLEVSGAVRTGST